MECLSGTHVRLRSRVRGTFLRADDDGVSVSLSADRASLATVWRVKAVPLRHLRGDFVSLQGAAYGRYLYASPGSAGGCFVRQKTVYGDETDVDALWLPLRVWGGAEDEVRVRHCRYGTRYIGVSAEDADEITTRWVIERVPWRRQRPVLPYGLPDPLSRYLFKRTILYARFPDGLPWSRFEFVGQSVLQLMAELAGILGEANPKNIQLFIWTGHKAPWMPLVTDLPACSDPMAVGVLSTKSQPALALRYPDVDAQ